MGMGVEIHEEDDSISIIAGYGLNSEDRRLFVRLGSVIKSIKVMP